MPTKLRPDQDLQCYFFQPSAVAALSGASSSGFTLSGSFRQQFDWAVIEWNRDNGFEHPLFRNLPDGDLSGLTLSYREQRSGCMKMDSDVYPTVEWPYLRVWANDGSGERVYRVPLFRVPRYAASSGTELARPVGTFSAASATFHLTGTPATGDYIGLAWEAEHYSYQLYGSDTPTSAVSNLAIAINRYSATVAATASGTSITVRYLGVGGVDGGVNAGGNGNRFGVYSYTSNAANSSWQEPAQTLSGGSSPDTWDVTLAFASLKDETGSAIPWSNVRKLRWTYAADLQAGAYRRTEFSVVFSNWSVTGQGLAYQVAGPGSFRVGCNDARLVRNGQWSSVLGNFYQGSSLESTNSGDSIALTISLSQAASFYLGTERFSPATGTAGTLNVTVDGSTRVVPLQLSGEDIQVRVPLASLAAGTHSICLTHAGPAGAPVRFQFLEFAVPTTTTPSLDPTTKATLATDWDTEHSLALPAERTAAMIQQLGYRGRVNHYAGALWFYELRLKGNLQASVAITFGGVVDGVTPNQSTTLTLGGSTLLQHYHLIGDTPASLAQSFALRINYGSTSLWASVSGSVLTLTARALGSSGNGVAVTVSTTSSALTIATTGTSTSGGQDGVWVTDLNSTPRLNRAARDWHGAFCRALAQNGVAATIAFSTELGNGDTSVDASIAQRYPDGSPVLLNTPALQTNFSPASLAYWQQVYLEMAVIMQQVGMTPNLQFGEVQWWYFPLAGVGMTFYDPYTTSLFQSQYGRALPVFRTPNNDLTLYSLEASFLAGLIGSFTDAIVAFVKATLPNTAFEVLYPTDVNGSAFMQAANLPRSHWGPSQLNQFKTESFTFTFNRDLNASTQGMRTSLDLGFDRGNAAHLVGISDPTTAWEKEAQIATLLGLGSVVLFALDQFCLIGFDRPSLATLPISASQGAVASLA